LVCFAVHVFSRCPVRPCTKTILRSRDGELADLLGQVQVRALRRQACRTAKPTYSTTLCCALWSNLIPDGKVFRREAAAGLLEGEDTSRAGSLGPRWNSRRTFSIGSADLRRQDRPEYSTYNYWR
jgi:hypothetical protein